MGFTTAVWIVIIGCVVSIGLILAAAARLEARWKYTHPPDDWDGTREEKFDEDD